MHHSLLSADLACVSAGLKTLGPALQYIAGELPVKAGEVLPILATHNTVRPSFLDQESMCAWHL